MIKLNALIGFVKKLSKRERIVFYSAVAVVSLMLLDRLVVGPVFGKLKSLDEQIVTATEGINRDVRILAQKDRIALQLTAYKGMLVPEGTKEEEFSDLMKEVETLANKNGVSLLDMKPGDIRVLDGAKQYLVSLNCEAPFNKLVDFLYGIESSKKMLKTDRFQLSLKSKQDPGIKCSITIVKIILPNS